MLKLSRGGHFIDGGRRVPRQKHTDLPQVTNKFNHLKLHRGHFTKSRNRITYVLIVFHYCIYCRPFTAENTHFKRIYVGVRFPQIGFLSLSYIVM
jgi:hypothetical protein